MTHASQIKVPATYMRGGTSKGVFFRLEDLPASCQQPGEARDRLFMRVIGSPDPYAKHIDGMGVMPLQFEEGTTRKTLGIDGTETYDVEGTPAA
ncbi:MAG: PrpF domain-containing protein, partial [Alcanivoracaceae bacterium]|nr:PrpF domain-containing protein [Alcanivoracaceae bacterium]